MNQGARRKDPFDLHRVALMPLLPDAINTDTIKACNEVNRIGEHKFLRFLLEQGLAPMWGKLLWDSSDSELFSSELKDTLHNSRMIATGAYLIHRHKLKLIREVLDGVDIPHVVYKGAHTRELLYDEPALRPAADIDVLVPPERKIDAVKAFRKYGFELHPLAEIISHEVSLVKGKTTVDLHWDILRPGRTRIPMADTLLSTRIDYDSHWGMNDEATLFLMLVHPVFVKYATAPQASLMRTIDLAKILAKPKLNWKETLFLLESAGLKTAAWITLKWCEMLMGIRVATDVTRELEPGKLRRKYLSYWLNEDLSSKFMEKPIYIQLALTLPAHDRPSDALRALRSIRALQKTADTDLSKLVNGF